uniref:Protein phosphatase 1 regulatory subunit 37 n=1 Tax=Calidris pygmaea TaxID=425635 RepID=A0A8C3KCC1_9CHAR
PKSRQKRRWASSHVDNDPAAAPAAASPASGAAASPLTQGRQKGGEHGRVHSCKYHHNPNSYPCTFSAQNVTVDEIMAAYKQACQKLNCKQIPKLLKQIQEFKDLAPRIDCLDLKGEKLDYKACEALEEIFKRVQFKIVDLEQTSLDEDGASALFDMIEYYESATHLNISFNKHIGTRGWQAAAHMMRKTNCLQYLDARNTPLLDHSAPFVARALRISSSLVVLHLENASLSGRPLMLLATALKMNMNLRELYLADNKLNGLQDSAQLGNLLKFNCYIQILDLRNNHILDSGLAYICEGLKEQRKGLVTLVLWNNQLTHTGMAYLGMTLPHTQSLETLNLGHNPIGNEGVRNLKNGLIGNRSVLRLGLASTKLTCEGAVAVAEFIAESPRLLRLDLRENEIKTGGLMALSLALKVNHSLLRLDLDREPKKESVKSFIETQKALLAEIQNGCKRNFILAKEKEEKEQKLQQSASMPEITVTEPLEEGLAEDSGDSRATPALEEGEEAGETLTASENGDAEPVEDDDDNGGDVTDSDSDTDEEADAGLETKDLSEQPERPDSADGAAALPPTPSPEKPKDRPPPLCIAEEPPSPAASAPPQGNERRISVSSPGRGHKIFVVTRVETLPDRAADAARLREDTGAAAAKPTEPQSPAPAAKPQLPAPRANGAVPESAAGCNAEQGDPRDCESVAHDTPLPNGLKTDFARALPEASPDGDGKTGSCAAEHGESSGTEPPSPRGS